MARPDAIGPRQVGRHTVIRTSQHGGVPGQASLSKQVICGSEMRGPGGLGQAATIEPEPRKRATNQSSLIIIKSRTDRLQLKST